MGGDIGLPAPAVPLLEVGDPAFPELGERVPSPLPSPDICYKGHGFLEIPGLRTVGSAGGSPGRALPTPLSAWGMALPDHSHL